MSQYTLSDFESSGVECPTCEDSFSSEQAMKIHHAKTHGESLSGVPVECHICGGELRVKKSRKESQDRFFCSESCEVEWRESYYSGGRNPNFKEKVVLECEICGDEFKEHESHADRRKTCSEACASEWFSRNLSGENHYNWSGGAPDYYGANWKRQRRRARQRDSEKCQDCGATDNLHVHHKTPISDFEVVENANTLDNLVTLCEPCHINRHQNEP